MKKSVLFLLSACLLIIAGCSSGGGDPKAVLSNFFEALSKKDFTAVKKYTTKDSESMLSMVEMGMKMAPDSATSMYDKSNMEMGDVVIDGDKATVPVKDKKSGESSNFVLKKEDGNWKVAFDKATLMGMAQDKMKEKGFDEDIEGSLDSLNEGMDSLKGAINNMSKEDLEKAGKMLDSASKVLKELPESN